MNECIYMTFRPCGCMTMITTFMPDSPMDCAVAVGKAIARGERVERMEWEEYRKYADSNKMFGSCHLCNTLQVIGKGKVYRVKGIIPYRIAVEIDAYICGKNETDAENYAIEYFSPVSLWDDEAEAEWNDDREGSIRVVEVADPRIQLSFLEEL
jgi:hypothetical protein